MPSSPGSPGSRPGSPQATSRIDHRMKDKDGKLQTSPPKDLTKLYPSVSPGSPPGQAVHRGANQLAQVAAGRVRRLHPAKGDTGGQARLEARDGGFMHRRPGHRRRALVGGRALHHVRLVADAAVHARQRRRQDEAAVRQEVRRRVGGVERARLGEGDDGQVPLVVARLGPRQARPHAPQVLADVAEWRVLGAV